MRTLVAKGRYSYGSKQVKVGEEFEATDKDSEVLVLVGRAAYAKPKRRAYRRRDLQPENTETIVEETPVRRRRIYRRRDMQAESPE